MTGINETKDVLIAVNELSILLIKHLKAGLNIADLSAAVMDLVSNEEVKAALGAAITNISAVPAEIGDLDMAEGLELATAQIGFIPKIIDAIKA